MYMCCCFQAQNTSRRGFRSRVQSRAGCVLFGWEGVSAVGGRPVSRCCPACALLVHFFFYNNPGTSQSSYIYCVFMGDRNYIFYVGVSEKNRVFDVVDVDPLFFTSRAAAAAFAFLFFF